MGRVSMSELTALGVEELEDVLEIMLVDAHNQRVIDKLSERK